jgi:hypothetical protein
MVRYRKKRFSRRKTPWYRKKYNAYQLAIKAYKATRYIKGLVNSEMLHKDFSYSAGTTITNTGFITSLNAISQDDTASGRTGNSILLRNIAMRFKVEVNPAVTLDTSVLFMLIKDTQQTADTNPSISDVLNTLTPESLLNLSSSGRYKILWRKTYMLTPASGGRPAIEIVKYFKVYQHIRFNGTSGNDIQKNGYFLIALSSENTNYPTIVGSSRIGYHDN